MGAITVGIIVSYLTMVRQLSQTINQASQQAEPDRKSVV